MSKHLAKLDYLLSLIEIAKGNIPAVGERRFDATIDRMIEEMEDLIHNDGNGCASCR